jgi:hypothetical protein
MKQAHKNGMSLHVILDIVLRSNSVGCMAQS